MSSQPPAKAISISRIEEENLHIDSDEDEEHAAEGAPQQRMETDGDDDSDGDQGAATVSELKSPTLSPGKMPASGMKDILFGPSIVSSASKRAVPSGKRPLQAGSASTQNERLRKVFQDRRKRRKQQNADSSVVKHPTGHSARGDGRQPKLISDGQPTPADLIALKPGGKKRKRRGLPKKIEKLLANANANYVDDNFEAALAYCRKAIVERPKLPEGYALMGIIYENQHEYHKAVDSYLLAAVWTSKDRELKHHAWKRAGLLAHEHGILKTAVYCFNKALHIQRDDAEARWKRSQIFLDEGEPKKALADLHYLIKDNPSDPDVYQSMARAYLAEEQPQKAIQALENYMSHTITGSLQDPSASLDLGVVNMLVECYLEAENYERIIEVINQTRNHLSKDEVLPFELCVNSGIANYHLGNHQQADAQFNILFDDGSVLECYDLFLKVADTFISHDEYQRAMGVVDQVVAAGSKYDTYYVWLRQIKCFQGLIEETEDDVPEEILEKAVTVYRRMIDFELPTSNEVGADAEDLQQDIDPDELKANKVDCRLSLSDTLSRMGRIKEAMEVMSHVKGGSASQVVLPQSAEGTLEPSDYPHALWSIDDLNVLLRKAKVYIDSGRWDECLTMTIPIITDTIEASKRWTLIPREKHSRTGKSPFIQLYLHSELWTLLMEVCRQLETQHDTEKAFGLVKLVSEWDASMSSRLDKDHVIAKAMRDFRFIALGICYNHEAWPEAYDYARYVLQENPSNPQIVDMFCQIMRQMRYPRRGEGILKRLNKKYPHPSLQMLLGHCRLSRTNYEHAVSIYLQVYQQQPDNPAVCLSLGIAYINASRNKYHSTHPAVVKGLAFLHKYCELRGHDAEASYNLARAYHCLDMFHLAVKHYEKALSSGDEDVRPFAAHNLANIYKHSGSHDMAQQIYDQYLIF